LAGKFCAEARVGNKNRVAKRSLRQLFIQTPCVG
jgi:hypothetical protein